MPTSVTTAPVAKASMTAPAIAVGGTEKASTGQSDQVGVWQYCSDISGAALDTYMLDYPFSDSPEPNGA